MKIETMIIGLAEKFRGLELEGQLTEFGLQPKRVPGIVADELPGGASAYVDQVAANLFLRRYLTAGEIGCALAHRSAYSNLLRSDAEMALIFEDDVRLVTDPHLNEIQRLLDSPQPRVILLNWNPDWTFVSRVNLLGKHAQPPFAIHATKVPPIVASAYAINRAAATTLYQEDKNVYYVSDWPARVAHKIRFLIAYPRPFENDAGAISTLQDNRDRNERFYRESSLMKAGRIIATAFQLKWLLNRRAYGSYGTYFQHEILRLAISFVARTRRRRLYLNDESSPFVIW